MALQEIIDRWLGNREGIDDYSRDEFEKVVERFKKSAEESLKDAIKFNAVSEIRLHRYVIENILDPLLGKIKYGKRQ